MPDGSPPLPTETELEVRLDQLAEHYREHARLTGSPLQGLLARFLAIVVAFKNRADFAELEAANWIPGLDRGWDHLLRGKRHVVPKRAPPPRAIMTVRDVAAILGWSKERARRWLKLANVPIARVGNRDLVNRRDVEKAAKLRQRKHYDKTAGSYRIAPNRSIRG